MNSRDLPLDLKLTERIEVEDDTLPHAEEEWNDPDQTEVNKGVEPNFHLTTETRQSKRERDKREYNLYGKVFAIDRIALDNIKDSVVELNEIMVFEDIELVDDT